MTRTCSSRVAMLVALLTGIMPIHVAAAQGMSQDKHEPALKEVASLREAAAKAQVKLQQTFTNLQFEDFGPSPVQGPIYQASAGGRIIYYAPQSEHLLFATVYDRNGVNLTALAQEQGAARRLKAIDPAKALAIGPAGAPTVIEFTDPDCPYCQALDRFWAAKAAEGKPVRRLIFFVSGIHPTAAAKAEHILCSPDHEAAFKAAYSGQSPAALAQCAQGHAKVADDAELVARIGISGTPTLIADGKLISGFQQGELEAFLDSHAKPAAAKAANDASR
jgi:thiol:disulfide interchange protein DsbC